MNDPVLEERVAITTTLGELVVAVYDVSETPTEALVLLARLLALSGKPDQSLAA